MPFKDIFPFVLLLTGVLALLFWIPIPGVRDFAGFHTFPYFLLIAFLDTLVLTYLILHSKWKGWKLVFTVFILFYGVMTFMSQIETVVFLNFLQDIVTKEEIPGLFLEGILIAGVYSPLAVFLYEKTKKKGQEKTQKSPYSPMRLFWKFLLVGVVYMFVYLIFGALVFKPLAGEAFNQYYGSTEFPSWMLPFQVLRGILWGFLAFLVLKMIGEWRKARWAAALLFSVIMGTLLLVPNPYMPDKIRLSHFVEVTFSNFLFGWLAVTILRNRKNYSEKNKILKSA